MSIPAHNGKKAPQFSSFKPAPTPQKPDDCCCEGACSAPEPVVETVKGTRYSWKVSGMDCAACARNNHLITVLFGAFGKAEQFIGGAVGRNHFYVMWDIQDFKDFGGELHGSPVAFGPHHDGDTRRIIAGRHASENSCGAGHAAFEATENSTIQRQGKRLRSWILRLPAMSKESSLETYRF